MDSDIVERLLEAERSVQIWMMAYEDDPPPTDLIAERDRLAALLRERIAAGDACASELATQFGGLREVCKRHRAAVDACEK